MSIDCSLGLSYSIVVIQLMPATNPTQRQWRLGARADLASEPTGRNRQSPWQPWKDVMITKLSQTTDATNEGALRSRTVTWRTGFDHMGFRVTDPSQLSEWEETFGDWRSTALRQFMLHNWGRDAKQALLQRTYDALPEGGALIVYDMAIDDERRRQPGWPPDEPEHADHGPGGVRLHRCGLSKLDGGRGLPRHLRGAPCRALFKGGGLQVNLTASSPTPRLRHDAYMPPAVRLRGEGECGWTRQEMLR